MSTASGGDEVDLTIIIVSFNTRALTLDCLGSIYRGPTAAKYEVVLVDNASADGSAEAVAQAFPQVKLIANADNRGFAAANNQGLRVARGRYLLLLNPDTLVLEDCLDCCVRYADAHPDIGVLGCQVLEDEQTVQPTCFRFPSPLHVLLSVTGLSSLLPHSRWFNREHIGGWRRDCERPVDVVSGMFMLVRREAMEQVGLMDEAYFVYAEEADWCFRFWRAGWRCVFVPVGRIIHREGGGQSTRLVNVRMFVQQQKSLLIFQRKNLGRAAYVAARTLLAVAMLQRWLLWRLIALIKHSPRAVNKAACAAAALRFHVWEVEPRP